MNLQTGMVLHGYKLLFRISTDDARELWRASRGEQAWNLWISAAGARTVDECTCEPAGPTTTAENTPHLHVTPPPPPPPPLLPTYKQVDTAQVFGPPSSGPATVSAAGDALGLPLPREVRTRGTGPSPRPKTHVDWDRITAFPTNPAGKEEEPLEPGTMLNDRHEVVRQLGRGGYANVYLVRDTRSFLEVNLAVKIPVSTSAPDPLFHQLRSQYKSWKMLSDADPNHFVRLINVEKIRPPGRNMMVGIFMEYLSGGNLAAFVANDMNGHPRNQLELARVLGMFLKVCEAARSLHAHGRIHRDIKPANVLLENGGQVCKLSDFELVMAPNDTSPVEGGTPPYMAPECFQGVFSLSSDIYALGITLYSLLANWLPDENSSVRQFPRLSQLNPILPPELDDIAWRCTDPIAANRPQDVADVVGEILRLGLSGDPARSAPASLARLLHAHLSIEDKSYLAETLIRSGFRSQRQGADHDSDLIEEYCYTASPRDVLADNCTARQLAGIAQALGVTPSPNRAETIDAVLSSIGFRTGPRQISGIESARSYLDGQLLELTHATGVDECVGIVHSGLVSVERTIDLLVRFFGQLVYGSGMSAFLSKIGGGKKPALLTFGQKTHALRELCWSKPAVNLPERVRQVFQWPIIGKPVFDDLEQLLKERNRLAHRDELLSFRESQSDGRKTLTKAIDVLRALSENIQMPRVVQVISREDDVYGRHFYMGRDDRNRSERLFTPLPLEVGEVYLFFPVTNPARINPIIFPYKAQS